MQVKFHQILRKERELRGWSQSRTAQELGTTPNTISAWERNLSQPSPYFREKLCILFDKNAQELGLLSAIDHPAVAVALQEEENEQDDTQLNDSQETQPVQEATPISPTSPVSLAKMVEGPGILISPFHILHSRRSIPALSCLLVLLIIGTAAVLWPLIIAPNPYTPGKGRLVLNDPLKDQGQQLNWQEGWNENNAVCQFKRDAYYSIQPREGYFHACIAQSSTFHNFAYEVEATLYQGDYIGIIFRAASSLDSKYYLFSVYRDGTYMLKRYVDRVDEHAMLLDSGTSAQIRKGLGQTNKLAVVAENQHLTLYVNQQIVTSVIDQSYSDGQIGVLAGNENHPPAEAAFQHAKVWSW